LLCMTWTRVVSDAAHGAAALLSTRYPTRMRVVTWNVWFGEQQMRERMTLLFGEVLKAAPDIICLQEVVPWLETSIRESDSLRSLYAISPFTARAGYGVLMLVRHSFNPAFHIARLPTRMGRELLIADAPDLGLRVATVHLESLDSEHTRRAQLEVAVKEMSGWPRAILCGDFNFDDRQTWGDWRRGTPKRAPEALENRVLNEVLPDWVDVWPAVHSTEPGITFDGATNPHVRNRNEIMRYDRIMVRRGAGALVPQAARLLGTSQTTASPLGLLPSDHYGLLVDVDMDCCHNTRIMAANDGIRAHDRPADGQALTNAERAAVKTLNLRDALR